MNESATHLPPTIGVLAANDDDVSRHAQVAQGAMQAYRLLGLVIDLRLNDKKVNVAVGVGPSTSMSTEQNYLRVRSSCSQAPPGLGNQSLVNKLHGRNRSRRLRLSAL